MMRTRKILALAAIGTLTLAACGSDADDAANDTVPVTTPAAADDEMADDDMADDDMADDDMADDDMADDDMADDEMADDEMADDDMADDDMADDDMADDDMADDDMADDDMAGDDVQSLINDRDDLSILDAVLHSTGLNDTLHSEGPFTVFAPSDAAFEAYLGEMGMTADDVVAEGEAISSLLLNHVVDGDDPSDMVMGMAGQSFTSLAGNPLDVVVDGDVVTINGATITEYDIVASNGVIHVIDMVIAAPAG